MAQSRKPKAMNPWTEEVVGVIRAMRKHTTFTTDQLWSRIILDKKRDPRAIGSALRAAATRGLIESTGGYRKSNRKACHGRPVAVWKRV